jgi:hypothetical protein
MFLQLSLREICYWIFEKFGSIIWNEYFQFRNVRGYSLNYWKSKICGLKKKNWILLVLCITQCLKSCHNYVVRSILEKYLLQNICQLVKEPNPNKGNHRSNYRVPIPRGDKLCNPVQSSSRFSSRESFTKQSGSGDHFQHGVTWSLCSSYLESYPEPGTGLDSSLHEFAPVSPNGYFWV